MSENERVGRIRKGRPNGGFTVVQNGLINHPDLSIEARGLMIYLLSRPDDWELRLTDVRRFLGTGGKPCGRDKTYKILSELRGHRYIVMCENVMDKQFAGVTYYVFDEPVADVAEVKRKHKVGEDALDVELGRSRPENSEAGKSPLPEKPEVGQLPLPDFPDTEKPEAIPNKDIYKTLIPPKPPKRKTKRQTGFGELRPKPGLSPPIIHSPWSIGWTELRIRRLMNGREKQPPKPTKLIQSIIDRGGSVGERERLAHQARHCWPSVLANDALALEGRGAHQIGLPAFDTEELSQTYHSVSVTSEEFAAWHQAHTDRGWPAFPTPTRTTRVWLPKAGPAALDLRNDRRSAA